MRHQRNIGSRQLDNRFHTPSVQQCAAERTQRDLDVFPAPDEGLGLPVIFPERCFVSTCSGKVSHLSVS